ncbi:hypothetical protein Hdeb2414_s0034g00726201 [Helianthus debilis subsp. tardiflorus]
MITVHMADDWKATYPQEGDTGVDAPAGYITLWANFFTEGNLRLPVTVFVAEVLEYYHLHISQLSPFGMFRIRNFEYTFRAHGLDVTVENFQRFYQLTVNTCFFSFNQRHGSLKLMTPPKGVTQWKRKFFYVKACAVYAHMTFRDVNVGVTDEDISVATAKTVEWFSRLRPIELKKLENNQLWVLRMMLTRPYRKARPVLREKSGANAISLWKMFEPDFEGKVELIPCDVREGFNLEIVGNFRVPTCDVLNAPVPEGEEPQDAGFSFFDAPLSSPHSSVADAGLPKEPAAPFVEVIPDPTVQVEKTVEKTASQIFDTVDSSNSLISPNDGDGLDLRFADFGPQKSGAGSQKSLTAEKVSGSASGGAGYEGPPIQPGVFELEYYYRMYTPERSTSYHRPPWIVLQGDDISNDPSACKEILGGLGTPFEVDCARAASHEHRINQLSTMLMGSSIVANAIMEDYKLLIRRVEEAVRMRAEAEKLELANLKAANAALAKEKAAAEAVAGRAKEDEARTRRLLKRPRRRGLAEVQTREVAVTDLTPRVTVAEERANAAVEARDALTSSFHQLEVDREWMRSHGIAHIVQAIMDAPETATGIDLIKQRARDAGFKAGYSRCISHINVMSKGCYTNQRSGFRDVDTEALIDAAVASFYDTSLSCVEKLDECLEAADYVDRLWMLYADAEEENPAGDGQDGAGTSGTK